MSSQALFGINVAISFVAWGAVAWNYLWPALKERSVTEAMKPILLLHGFRFIGLAFLVPGVVSAELPAAFARPAAYGDLITAIVALLALAALGTRTGTVLTWAFSIIGTTDLLYAVYQGIHTSFGGAPGLLGAGYFLVTAIVPLLLITHGLAFRILLRSKVVLPAQSKVRVA